MQTQHRATLSAPPFARPASHRHGAARTPKPKAVFALDPEALDIVYGQEDRVALAELVDIGPTILTPENWREHTALLGEAEILCSGWKSPVLDAEFLAAAPKLRAVFYAAGSVRYWTTEAFWDRGIALTTSYAANALPVAEYTVATSILSLKQFWRWAERARRGEGWGDHTRPIRGSFRATIGLVSFGMIARRTAELLASYDVGLRVYCPFLSDAESAEHGVQRLPLDELFSSCDVVSVHTPLLPETTGLINGRLVRRMRPEATLLNTARGRVLDQPSVIEALRDRPDLTAVLDVTNPEPPAADDPLFSLPNVIVTPHIAGSHGAECQRLGHYMVEELRRYLNGEPLRWPLSRELARRMA